MKMPRLRFSLRFVFLLPVLVTAFFGGWNAHDHQLRRRHRYEEATALQHRAALHQEIRRFYDAAERVLAPSAAGVPWTIEQAGQIERMEQQQRIDSFRPQSDEPIHSPMSPNGLF